MEKILVIIGGIALVAFIILLYGGSLANMALLKPVRSKTVKLRR